MLRTDSSINRVIFIIIFLKVKVVRIQAQVQTFLSELDYNLLNYIDIDIYFLHNKVLLHMLSQKILYHIVNFSHAFSIHDFSSIF